MISRNSYVDQIEQGLARSPIVALLGPRQCGKTTLAKHFAERKKGRTTYYDLESVPDQRRLANPERILGGAEGLVILDEIQHQPHLFPALRVVVDRQPRAKFLILGNASPHLARDTGESLAGRVEFVDLAGFDLEEVGAGSEERLWVRGGFPRSYLAASDEDAASWREGFARTFLERDLVPLGLGINPEAMRRFWSMLAHVHGQTWNSSELARSMGVTDKTVRRYLDALTHAFMIRQLQPWHENIGKRQVKAPKIYFRDSGLLHTFIGVRDFHGLSGHPRVGASWEGFAMEQVLRRVQPFEAYFWATHAGAELDLYCRGERRRIGFEFKRSEAPTISRSMRVALSDLHLDRLWIVAPVTDPYELDEGIAVIAPSHLNRVIDGL